jgi:hypothetical protein
MAVIMITRGMVDTGHRLREEDALTALAEAVCASAAPDAPDRGAALCVLAYQLLASGAPPTAPIDDLAARIEAYLAAGPATPHGQRWTVSLLFALAKLWLGHGDFTRARTALERCVSVDPLAFRPPSRTGVLASPSPSGPCWLTGPLRSATSPIRLNSDCRNWRPCWSTPARAPMRWRTRARLHTSLGGGCIRAVTAYRKRRVLHASCSIPN